MRLSHPLYKGGEERDLLAGHRPRVVWQRRGQGPHRSHLWGLRPSLNLWGPKKEQKRLQGQVLPLGGVPSVWPRSKVQRKGGVECFGD